MSGLIGIFASAAAIAVLLLTLVLCGFLIFLTACEIMRMFQ